MCIMFGKMNGVPLPSEDTLDNCYSSNRDGMGIAWTNGDGKVMIKKDFNTHTEFKEWLFTNIKIGTTAIVHYRLGTAGLKDCGNAHPFPLTQDKKELRAVETVTDIAMAHNGVLKGLGDKKYSDTQEFIMNIIADPVMKANIHHKPIMTLLMAYLDNSKLLFLHGNGTIWKYGEFTDDEGLFYSNIQFRGYRRYTPPADDYCDDFGFAGGYNAWKHGRVWSHEKNKWIDKPDTKTLIEDKTKKDVKSEDIIKIFLNCFECGQTWPEANMYKVVNKIINVVAARKMCKRCFHNKGQCKFYDVFDEVKHKDTKVITPYEGYKGGDHARVIAES